MIGSGVTKHAVWMDRAEGAAMWILKLARTFDVLIEDLFEVVKE